MQNHVLRSGYLDMVTDLVERGGATCTIDATVFLDGLQFLAKELLRQGVWSFLPPRSIAIELLRTTACYQGLGRRIESIILDK